MLGSRSYWQIYKISLGLCNKNTSLWRADPWHWAPCNNFQRQETAEPKTRIKIHGSDDDDDDDDDDDTWIIMDLQIYMFFFWWGNMQMSSA